MRKRRTFLAVVLLCVVQTAATACLNDSDSDRSEFEFRSHYVTPAPSREGFNVAGVAGAVVGIILCVASLVWVRRMECRHDE